MTDATWAAARSSRRGKEHETRTALLACAARVFAEQGYAAASIATITDAAQVSRATFYLYFTSKKDVFAALAEQVRDEFLAVHEIPGVNEDDPYELGHASAAAYLATYAANLELMTVLEHQALADTHIQTIWQEIQERPRRRVARYVERLAAEGVAHPAASPEAVSEAIIGIFARFARIVPDDEAGFARCVDELTAIYLRLLGIDRR